MTTYKLGLISNGLCDYAIVRGVDGVKKASFYPSEKEAREELAKFAPYVHAKLYTVRVKIRNNNSECVVIQMEENRVVSHVDTLDDAQFALGHSPFCRLYTRIA